MSRKPHTDEYQNDLSEEAEERIEDNQLSYESSSKKKS